MARLEKWNWEHVSFLVFFIGCVIVSVLTSSSN